MVSTEDSKSSGSGSNPDGETINSMDAIIQSLKENAERVLIEIGIFDREVRARGLENEQWFIDWQDELNRISVK